MTKREQGVGTSQFDDLDQHPIIATPRQDAKEVWRKGEVILPALPSRELHDNSYCGSHYPLIVVQKPFSYPREAFTQSFRIRLPAWQEAENRPFPYPG